MDYITRLSGNEVAQVNWNGWPLERVLILFVALMYLVIGIQVAMFHYRQNFHQKVMYVPVVLSPIMFLIGLLYVIWNNDAMRYLFVGLLIIASLVGLVGFYYHIRGVGARVGGYGLLRNFLIGPPIILPLLLTAMGVLGLIALYWGD